MLSPEQFSALRKQGLSIQQIVKFESGGKPDTTITSTVPDTSLDFTSAPSDVINPQVTPRNKKETYLSAVSKTLKGANDILGYIGSQATKHIYAPLAEHLPIDENAKARLKAIEASPETVYPSDAVDAITPFLKGAEAAPFASGVGNFMLPGKFATRMIIDAGLDPLTYATFGEETALGRMSRIAREAKLEGIPIKLDSDLAKGIAAETGANMRPSPKMIKDFMKANPPAKGLAEQLATKQKSLLALSLPWDVENNIPLITGKIPGKIVQPLSAVGKIPAIASIGDKFRELFSTRTGNEDYDVLYNKFKDLAAHRVGQKLMEGKELNQTLDDLSSGLGLPREKIEDAVRQLGEAPKIITKKDFAKSFGKDIYDNLINHYQDKLVDAQVNLKNLQPKYAQAIQAGDDVAAGKIKDLMDTHANNLATYNGEINKLTGKYTPPPSISPEVDKLVKNLRQKNASQLLDEMTSGVPVKPLMADVEHLAHIMTPEARQIAMEYALQEGKLPPKLSQREMSTYLANSIRRQFVKVKPEVVDAWKSAGIINGTEARVIKGKSGLDELDKMFDAGKIDENMYNNIVHTLTIDEVNQLGREGKIGLVGNKKIDQFFHTDPTYYNTIRYIRGEKARTSAEFYNELIKRNIAVPAEKAPANFMGVRQPELEGYKFSPEVAKSLNKINEFYTKPGALKSILDTYDKFHSLNKAWTLAIFPAYHIKNMVGNFWNNFLADVNPLSYGDALKVRTGGKINFKDVLGNNWDRAKILEEAQKRGVVNRGIYSVDAAGQIEKELQSGKLLTLSHRSKILQAGKKAGQEIEDNARMAHFIDRLKKGDTADQAALSVKKYLFDYGDMSDFERNVLNRAFFFYKWTRSNIPLQLHSLITNPAKFGLPFKAKHEIEKEVPDAPERYLPEWMKENFPVRIRYNAKNKQYEYFMLNNWLPAADMLKLAHLHDIAAESLAPLPKELIQQLFNYDIFTKKKIESIPGEKSTLFNQEVPARLAHGAKTIRLLNEIDKLTAPDKDLYSKIMGLAVGKNYPFDYKKGIIANTSRVQGDMDALNQSYRKELQKRPLNKKEILRIRELMKSKVKEF